jgi:hypothetical protein
MKFKDIVVDYSSVNCTVDSLVETAELICKIKRETEADPMNIQLWNLKECDSIEDAKYFFSHDFGRYCSIVGDK